MFILYTQFRNSQDKELEFDLQTYQGLAILGLESRDQDQYKLIVSVVVETRPGFYFPQSQYRDRDFFCFSLDIETG